MTGAAGSTMPDWWGRYDDTNVSVSQYEVTVVSSASLSNRLSTSPWQSLQSRNFSTIHAASPAGESAKLAAYRSAYILAVDEVPFDSKLLRHESVHCVSDRLACRDVTLRDGGKTESREGRHHHVCLLKSIGERQQLHEGVRPTVQHHHGRCSRCL
jgi:hypothetical protein